jgi:hypothetical protein
MKRLAFSLILFTTALAAHASGDDGSTLYVPQYNPRHPYAQYLQGSLGVFAPDYFRRYLIAAYRQMTDNPLGANEVLAFTPPEKADWEVSQAAIDAWQAARGTVLKPSRDYLQQTASYEETRQRGATQERYTVYYNNCLPEAFKTATKTLQRYRDSASTALTVAWTEAQDQVFSNCGKPGQMPAALPSEQPGFARQDRAYQIASAHFYARSFEQAERAFLAIAADTTSAWSSIGLYLAGRSALRAADLGNDPQQIAQARTRARKYLTEVQGNPRLAAWHASAQGLIRLMMVREFDQRQRNQRLQLLARKLAAGSNAEPVSLIAEDLRETEMLMDQALDNSATSEEFDTRTTPMLDWIATFQCANADHFSPRGTIQPCLEHALQQWRSQHSLPWAVAAMELLHANRSAPQPIPADIAAFARTLKPSQPAYAYAQFHLVFDAYVAMAKMNGSDPARQIMVVQIRNELDRLMALGNKVFPFDSMFLLQNMRVTVASNLQDFKNQLFYSSANLPWYGSREVVLPAWAALDAGMSITGLWQLAQLFAGQDEEVRSAIENAAITRSLALGQHAQAKSMMQAVLTRHPGLETWFSPYLKAQTADTLRNESMMLLASQRQMGFSIEPNFHAWEKSIGNHVEASSQWWWSNGLSREKYWMPSRSNSPRISPLTGQVMLQSIAGFGSDMAIGTEAAALQKLGDPTSYLGRFVLDHFKTRSQRTDARVPYVMAMLIASTRSGVEDATLSRDLFVALHKWYPDNPWALKTKYYY